VHPKTALEAAPLPALTAAPRLESLDVFRGGTIAAMILVNNPGSGAAYAPLLHAEWHGWTFTDLVFPFFLWIVGVAITLSFTRRVRRGDDRTALLLHTARRAAIIFAIGLFLNGFPYFDFGSIRIPGVLQRIAVCYFIAAALYLFATTRGRLWWTAGLLVSYWMLMKLVPVPGCATGSLTVDCNFAKYVDGLLLSGHMWSQSRSWDPEGIISTLPAIATTLFGVFAGEILAARRAAGEKTSWMFWAGACLLSGGLMLSMWMPINKKLWTAPYALFTAGIAFLVFASCYWLVDVQGWRRYVRPLTIYGVNALALYVLSGLFARILGLLRFTSEDGSQTSLRALIWQNVFLPLASPANASLLFALAHVLLFFCVAWWMYRKNWIVRV
jgi:predicted acyltransferase